LNKTIVVNQQKIDFLKEQQENAISWDQMEPDVLWNHISKVSCFFMWELYVFLSFNGGSKSKFFDSDGANLYSRKFKFHPQMAPHAVYRN
jgi:hypothetical protein